MRQTLRDSALKHRVVWLYPLLSFYVYLAALGLADWGHGVERGMLLIAGGVGIYLVARQVRIRPPSALKAILVAVVIALMAFRIFELVGSFEKGKPDSDIASTTMQAVAITQAGGNPYQANIDKMGATIDPEGQGFRFFGGFKYGPITTWGFTPAVRLGGTRGYATMNLILWFLVAAGAGWWASRSGTIAGLGASLLVLVPPFLGHELFSSGVNDSLPVALGLWAFAFRSCCMRGAPARGGFMIASAILIGLSFGAKPLPALFYALPLIFMGSKRVQFSVIALATGGLCYLGPALSSPKELIAGLVFFNLVRPTDSTSLAANLPELVQRLSAIGFACAALWSTRFIRKGIRTPIVAAVSSLSLALFLAGGSHIHRNYLLWLVPLMAVALTASIWREERHHELEPRSAVWAVTTQTSR